MDVAVAESKNPVLADLIPTCVEAFGAAHHLLVEVRTGVSKKVLRGGRLDATLLDEQQFAAHGYSWVATYVAGLQQMLAWAERLESEGKLSELEQLMLQAAYGEYLSQIAGGIPMTQVESVRPRDMGVSDAALHAFYTPAVSRLIAEGNFGDLGVDETLGMVRDQFRRFVEDIAWGTQVWIANEAEQVIHFGTAP